MQNVKAELMAEGLVSHGSWRFLGKGRQSNSAWLTFEVYVSGESLLQWGVENTFSTGFSQLWLWVVQMLIEKSTGGHWCLLNLSRNGLTIWTSILISCWWRCQDCSSLWWNVHCLSWNGGPYWPVMQMIVQEEYGQGHTVVDGRALWVSTVDLVVCIHHFFQY